MKNRNDGTVTISIKRFKELEAIESGNGAIYSYYYYDKSATFDIVSQKEIIKRFEELESRYVQKMKKLYDLNELLEEEVKKIKAKKSFWGFLK